MDRLSRDQEDIAGLFKRMAFAGVRIVTLSEGDVTHLHVGLKGTMNALFLKDLADKTRRGLRGRVENGKSGGGLCFGYDVVKQFAADGEPIRGDRTINPGEAAIVRRIFSDYLAGKSSRTIAWELNKEGIPGPQRGEWGPSTIHGNPKRGVGILNNELYVGRLVWNRLRYLKDPDTGKRVSRNNRESEWIIQDVLELRIIDQDVWDAVKAQQQKLAYAAPAPWENTLNERRRPKYLFAGLMKCGRCGSGYTLISKDLLGCAAARNKGTCDNRLNIRRDTLEASVLNGLRTHRMEPNLFKEFCEEFTREVNRRASSAARASWGTEKNWKRSNGISTAPFRRSWTAYLVPRSRPESAALRPVKPSLPACWRIQRSHRLSSTRIWRRSTDSGFRHATSAFKAMTGGPRLPRCSGPRSIG
jgi:hypothetical protein